MIFALIILLPIIFLALYWIGLSLGALIVFVSLIGHGIAAVVRSIRKHAAGKTS